MTHREIGNADRHNPSATNAVASRASSWSYGLTVLIGLEAVWLVWFLCQPLPNAPTNWGVVRRGIFLVQFFPGVLPQIRFEQSHLGLAIGELSHVENLAQRLPIALAAALIAASAIALGRLVVAMSRHRASFRFLGAVRASASVSGTTGLGAITLLVGRLGMLSTGTVRAGLVLFIAVELIVLVRERFALRIDERLAPAPDNLRRPALWSVMARGVGFLLIVGPFLLVMMLGALLPTVDYDALSYHLQGPKEFYQQGRITFLPHNVYTSMPFGVEMLHLMGMVVLGDWWRGALAGQLLVALFAPATALLIARTAGRWWSGASGLVRRRRLPHHSLDLSIGSDPLRRRSPLLLPRGACPGGNPSASPRRGRVASASGAWSDYWPAVRWPASIPRWSPLSCHSACSPCSTHAVVRGRVSFWPLGSAGRSSWAPGWSRTWSTPATPFIRSAIPSSAAGTGTRTRTPSGGVHMGLVASRGRIWPAPWSMSPAVPTGSRRSMSRWRPGAPTTQSPGAGRAPLGHTWFISSSPGGC